MKRIISSVPPRNDKLVQNAGTYFQLFENTVEIFSTTYFQLFQKPQTYLDLLGLNKEQLGSKTFFIS